MKERYIWIQKKQTYYKNCMGMLPVQSWIWIGQAALRIVIIIILAFILKAIGTRVINAIFRDKSNSPIRLTTSRREQTLKNLLNNVLSYVLVAIVILMILDTFDVPIRTMLAGAGVVGL